MLLHKGCQTIRTVPRLDFGNITGFPVRFVLWRQLDIIGRCPQTVRIEQITLFQNPAVKGLVNVHALQFKLGGLGQCRIPALDIFIAGIIHFNGGKQRLRLIAL